MLTRVLAGGALIAAGIGLFLLLRAEPDPLPAQRREAGTQGAQAARMPAHVPTTSPEEERVETDRLAQTLEAEDELEAQGIAARERLIRRQVQHLSRIATQAEASGNSERARLMRARIAALEGASAGDD